MFNWGYALIGFMIGFLGIKLPGNSVPITTEKT